MYKWQFSWIDYIYVTDKNRKKNIAAKKRKSPDENMTFK